MKAISDVKIEKIVGVPNTTLRDWKKKDRSDYRRVLYDMLKNMSDAASIGPSMATALITTFYGSVLANYLCAPVANKLKVRNSNEFMMKSIMVEGILSIQAGENPRVTEEKLKSFMSPGDKKAYEVANAEASGSEGGEG